MMHMKALATLAVVMLLASCGGPQESAAMKEAKAVHGQLTRISGELHESLMAAMAPLEDKIDSAMMLGDTVLATELAKLEGQLDRIDVRFHDWSRTVAEIPGQACTHDHDHTGHDHGHSHDHEGHDHDHDHDHGVQLPEGLSDEEVLEIQQALMAALDKLKGEFDRTQE